jgi:hypothetical protein
MMIAFVSTRIPVQLVASPWYWDLSLMFAISELSRLDAAALKIIDILLQAFSNDRPCLVPSFNYPAVVTIQNRNFKPEVEGVHIQVHLV